MTLQTETADVPGEELNLCEGSTFGDFLRNRRARMSPSEAGIPAGGRRRTPGLRREELALLAGISVDYLTRMEQGREANPSLDVLGALARALQLTGDEWFYMKNLVSGSDRPDRCPTSLLDTPIEAPTLILLDRLDPTPAFVLEQTGDVIAWNRAYGGLMAATGLFDLDRPNLLRYTFLVPAARSLFLDWDGAAAGQVAQLRAAVARWPDDQRLHDLIGELAHGSPAFVNLWASQDVALRRRGRKHFDHPVVGELVMEFEGLSIPDASERLLVTYLASNDQTNQAFEKLAADGLPHPSRD